MPDDGYMNEEHMAIVERRLLSLSGARRGLCKAGDELEADDAAPHLVEALRIADQELEAVYKRVFQRTYFHVPDEVLQKLDEDSSAGR